MFNLGSLERFDICEMYAKSRQLDGLLAKELSYPVLYAKFLDNGKPFDYVMLELKPDGVPHRMFTNYPDAEKYLNSNYEGADCLTFLVLFDSGTGDVLDALIGITTEAGLQDEAQSTEHYLFPCERYKLVCFASVFYQRWKDTEYAIDLEHDLYKE